MLPAALAAVAAIALVVAPPSPEPLADLQREAEATHTAALIVERDGRRLVERRWNASPRFVVHDVARVLAPLAIGILIRQNRLAGLDTPMSRWYPSWKAGINAGITLGWTLQGRSGLDALGDFDWRVEPGDRLKEVVALKRNPAAGWWYDPRNEVVPLVAGIVKQETKLSLDAFLDRELFRPLGITGWTWRKDRAGTPALDEGLALGPEDLLKLGRLMLDEGRWGDGQLVPQGFAVAATSALDASGDEGHHGYQWATVVKAHQTPEGRRKLQDAGFAAADKLAPLDGRVFYADDFFRYDAYFDSARPLLTPDEWEALQQTVNLDRVDPLSQSADRAHGFYARGKLGQHLVVLPGSRVVAVRLRATPAGKVDPYVDPDAFESFPGRLAQIFN